MYGIFFDCLEKFVLATFGTRTWSGVLQKADIGIGMKTKWTVNENYPDEAYMKLMTLLAFEIDRSFDDLVEELGSFFTTFIR
jgi:hypothetical protein